MQNKPYKFNLNNLLPLGIVLIILIMLMTTTVSFINMCALSKEMINTTQQNTIKEGLLRKMTESSLNRSILLLEMIRSDDIFTQDELYLQINKLATSFTVARENLVDQNLDSHQRLLLDKQGNITKLNNGFEQQVYENIITGETENAKILFYESTVEGRYKNAQLLKELSNYQNIASKKTISDLEHKQEIEHIRTTSLGLISLLISMVLTFIIVKTQNKNHKKLSKIAVTDTLTSLPNRNFLIQKIEETLISQPEELFCIVFLDIDYFKSINDNFGHEVGDETLKCFSEKIRNSIHPDDVLSRFGGDEFVVLLRSTKTLEQAHRVISDLCQSLDTSFHIDENEIYVTSSIGASVYTQDSGITDYKILLKQADSAMYESKESGRNCYKFFSKNTYNKIRREHQLSHSLSSIIKNNNKDKQLTLKYQPMLNIADNTINECEALIRWTTDIGEYIPTDEFISIANKRGDLIEKINSIVIEEVCKQQSEWKQKKCPNIRININLSGNKVYFSHLLEEFKNTIKRYNLSPSQFGIDLTETTIIEANKESIEVLSQLRDQGMKISIDDFGTGYSSLSYLKKLPISTIKIDKSFISGLPNINDDQELVKTIINVGHTFNLDIVAEGVETEEQLKFLLDHDCDAAQGYYFHHPLNHSKMVDLHITSNAH